MQTSTSTQFLHNTLVSNSNRNNYNPVLFNVAPHWWWFLVLPLENTNSQNLDVPREPIELSPMSPSVIAVQGLSRTRVPREEDYLKISLPKQNVYCLDVSSIFCGWRKYIFLLLLLESKWFGSPAVKPSSHAKAMVGNGCRLPWYCLNPSCGSGLKASTCWDQIWNW